MVKTKQSLMKDDLKHVGEYWIHVPEMNIRQASGVQFNGKYVSRKEYFEYLKKKRRSEGNVTASKSCR